jgi:hypothetical protein
MHVMNTKTRAENPLELAIDAIEMKAQVAGTAVAYVEFQQHARAMARTIQTVNLCEYVDHTLSLLVHAGYLERLHVAPGQLAYAPTPAWPQRDQLLCTLRAPVVPQRVWRIRKQEAKRAEKMRRKLEAAAAEQLARQQAREDAERRRAARRAQLALERGLTPSGNIRRASSARRQTTMMEQRA